MIVLRVLSYNGAAADGPQAQFDEIGGTIGRADTNQLVLPDPERTISRIHARVVFRAGNYAVVDNGSNPIAVNGLPVGAGREHPLKPGDQIQIGGYLIAISAVAAAASADPFADLFADVPMGLATPVAAAPPAPRAAAAWPPPAPPAPQRTPPLQPGHIPDDWDPFAIDSAPADAPALRDDAFGGLPALRDDAFGGVPAGASDSLDELFGLAHAPAGVDPLGAAPAALAAPNTAAHDDAFEALARTAQVVLPTRPDHGSELNTPMPRPRVQTPASAPLPSGAVFSWDDPPRDGRVVTLPGVRRSEAEALAAAQAVALAAGATAPATAPAAAPRAATQHGDALLTSLLQGLDTPGLRLDALTPEVMLLVGQLLRESMRGTVELLVARAALKREMRASVTMIVARENNPLKFSPNVEVALQHLLGPPSEGFMPAAVALRDAYDDLRAHQIGVMAGMRAALDGVLQRFDPVQLESKLTRKSAIASLIPSTRKARLWELFQELFAQLQTEAHDDFEELFGRAFLRAYEDQLKRLQREPK